MDSELIKKIMKVYISQLEENGEENVDLNHESFILYQSNQK